MIQIENTEVFGFETAIRGMRNAHESWDKSDSEYDVDWIDDSVFPHICGHDDVVLGENDLTLMKKLVSAGTDHSKFMRMIHVQVDITAPRYWWAEADTYKVGTVANSCSTMHSIHKKEFTLDDFSHEHLTALDGFTAGQQLDLEFIFNFEDALVDLIDTLNIAREKFLETDDKRYWWQIIQMLPSSYNQRRTVDLNYAVLRNMYHARKNHKLDEWSQGFTEWVESLPYSELITM